MSVIQVRQTDAKDSRLASDLLEEYCESVGVVVRDDQSARQIAMWVAFCECLPAGCIVLRPLGSVDLAGEVKRLYVRTQYRGKGIAARLLREVEKFAVDTGLKWLYLDTTADMQEAQRLYLRSGYQPCDRYNTNPQASVFMRKALAPICLREFEPGDETAFCELNEAWIKQFFELEEKDRQTLRQPEKYILSKGGQIFMALREGDAVGCCAIIPMEDGAFELSKMGVAETERGNGIGRRLLEHVIAQARQRQITRLYLETNSRLKNAVHLYESVGFTHLPPERVAPSAYQRANVYMELILSNASPAPD